MSVAAFHFDRKESEMLTLALYAENGMAQHWLRQIAERTSLRARTIYFIGELEDGLIANEPIVVLKAFTLDPQTVESQGEMYEKTCNAWGITGRRVVWDYRVDTLTEADYTFLHSIKGLFIP